MVAILAAFLHRLGSTVELLDHAVELLLFLLFELQSLRTIDWLPEPVVGAVVVFFGAPFGWCFFAFPTLGPPARSSIIVSCIAIGVNSFCWGYSVAAIWKWYFVAPTRGHDVAQD